MRNPFQKKREAKRDMSQRKAFKRRGRNWRQEMKMWLCWSFWEMTHHVRQTKTSYIHTSGFHTLFKHKHTQTLKHNFNKKSELTILYHNCQWLIQWLLAVELHLLVTGCIIVSSAVIHRTLLSRISLLKDHESHRNDHNVIILLQQSLLRHCSYSLRFVKNWIEQDKPASTWPKDIKT